MTSVLQLSYSDAFDGASRAAYRLHSALRANGINSQMRVVMSRSGDWSVAALPGSRPRLNALIREAAGRFVGELQYTSSPILHSTALLPSAWPTLINASGVDVVHLHWINREMLSIGDIARIDKPIVWTLHDMWAFCGAEHYTTASRWREAYTAANRDDDTTGLDINRWVWRRKQRAWTRPLHIVTPSRWLADCVRESALMRTWPVEVVPNAIDTDVWAPIAKPLARELAQLPRDRPLIAFGAVGGARDPRKGFDLLRAALRTLRTKIPELELVIFGQLAPRESLDLGLPAHYLGHLHDDLALRVLYSAVDAFVIPSRQDNLPNTGLEALACGTPVVAFATGGLPDIVTHQNNGYLAEPFLPESLACGIAWVLNDRERHAVLCQNARECAVTRYAPGVVTASYRKVYERACSMHSS